MMILIQNTLPKLFEIFSPLLPGIIVVVEIFTLTLLFSIPLGIVLAIGHRSRFKMIGNSIGCYIWMMRGTPLMLQLIFVYFGANSYGIGMDRFTAVIIAFVLNYAAYFAEIFRAGIQSIDRSQYEGADVLGLSYWQTMYRIILPQTIKRVLPPVANEVIALVKDTSLAQVIGIMEIFAIVKTTAARDFVIYPFLIASGFYLIMTLAISRFFTAREKGYSYYE